MTTAIPPDHCDTSNDHVEWTGVVPAEGPPLLRDDRGEIAPSPERMLWMFTGQRVRIRIESLGPAPAAEGSKTP